MSYGSTNGQHIWRGNEKKIIDKILQKCDISKLSMNFYVLELTLVNAKYSVYFYSATHANSKQYFRTGNL